MKTIDQIMKELLEFERDLKIGDEVEARWTWCHGYYTAKAKVVKLNKSSIRCELLEDVSTWSKSGGWPTGFQMRFPRLFTNTHSANNGVYPPRKN